MRKLDFWDEYFWKRRARKCTRSTHLIRNSKMLRDVFLVHHAKNKLNSKSICGNNAKWKPNHRYQIELEVKYLGLEALKAECFSTDGQHRGNPLTEEMTNSAFTKIWNQTAFFQDLQVHSDTSDFAWSAPCYLIDVRPIMPHEKQTKSADSEVLFSPVEWVQPIKGINVKTKAFSPGSLALILIPRYTDKTRHVK